MRPFAHKCQHHPTSAEPTTSNNVGSSCVRLHTTANSIQHLQSRQLPSTLGVAASVTVCTGPYPFVTAKGLTLETSAPEPFLRKFNPHYYIANNSQVKWSNLIGWFSVSMLQYGPSPCKQSVSLLFFLSQEIQVNRKTKSLLKTEFIFFITTVQL